MTGYLSNIPGNPDNNTIRGPNARPANVPPLGVPKPGPFALFKAGLPNMPSIYRLFQRPS